MPLLKTFFDCETTGLPVWKSPSEDPCQPHIVEIAALLCNEAGIIVDRFEALIRPAGWTITPEMTAIHGITNEMAMDLGISEAEALEGFMALHSRASLRVAHNITFDDRIVRIALMRYQDEERANAFKDGSEKYCTCFRSRSTVALPDNKLPNLGEAYQHFTGEPLAIAHRAMPDTLATRRIYHGLEGITPPSDDLALAAGA